jgi:RHS repeat-associated protein
VQTSVCHFSYDSSGRLSGYDDGDTSAVYMYDALGRKLSDTVNYGAFSKTLRYTYYANGQKQSVMMPDGTTYSYTYNDNNGLEDIRIPGVGAIEYPSYTLNRPDRVTFPGGMSHTFRYDALLRVNQISASGLNYGYTYDNVSNILTKTTGHGNYEYAYDDVYRLTNAAHPTLDDEAYTYDGVGNRATASGVTGSITHNANNELTLYGEIEYEYDANGNLVRKSLGTVAVNYSYNAANRLIRVEDELSGLVIAEYGYDPFGRRLWKAVNGTRTYFLYADEGLVAEYDASGNELRSYGYQPDSTWGTNPLWLKQNGQYYWYQNDHLGTPQKLVDMNKTVVWEARYDAFGNAEILVETVVNHLRFPGQYFDAETGWHYNWFRYYIPGIGRYNKLDPIGFLGRAINLYVYALNSPINLLDSLGLRSCDADKQKFFNWLKDHIKKMANDLNVPEDFLWALAAKEGGWSNHPPVDDPENPGQKIGPLDRNIRENMPFGVQHWIDDPKRPGKKKMVNKPYDSLDEAFDDWRITGQGVSFEDRVRDATMIQEFIDGLQCVGIPEDQGCKQYNTRTGTWATDFLDRYNQIVGEPSSPQKYRQVGFKKLCQDICDF